MAKHRITIAHDDYEKIRTLFNIEENSRPNFVLMFHRLVECVEMLLDRDETGVEEELHMKWAINEANYQQWLKEKGEQR